MLNKNKVMKQTGDATLLIGGRQYPQCQLMMK